MLARTCHDCGQLKPEDSYYGKNLECSACHKEQERAVRRESVALENNLHSLRVHGRTVLVAASCNNCHQLKMASDFYPDRGGKPTGWCRECRKRKYLALQEASRSGATRHGAEWTGPELEILARRDLTARQIATMLGRTLGAVNAARSKLNREPRERWLAGVAQPLDVPTAPNPRLITSQAGEDRPYRATMGVA